jgi:copper chaperone CopZ
MTCAYAVRVALKKISGVDSVDVSLNKGLATIKLKPGNEIRPEEFWETIRRNGFTPKAAHVLVRGEVLGGGDQFKVSGTDELFQYKADAKVSPQLKAAIGKTVMVEGALTRGKDLKMPIPLEIQSMRQ